MLRYSARLVEQGWPGFGVLNAAPDLTHPEFNHFVQDANWQTRIQVDGDIGVRMREVLVEGIEQYGAAVVLGTDIPSLDLQVLHRAWRLLKEGRQVVGPSQDGGFYLLGLSRMPNGLFEGIIWGGAKVYSRLVCNARQHDLLLEPLPTLSDCDYFEDLCWAVNSVPEFAHILSATGFDMNILGRVGGQAPAR